jgi:flagellar basal-body rod modification protein FlgD
MTVAATTAATTTTTSTSTSSSASTSGLSSTQFLTLLVSELQNQNPLDPTNSTDFVNQLTSYANFEQQQTLNSNMSTLVSSLNSLLTLNSSNYIGQTVTAKADTGTLQSGQIAFGYSLDSAAKDVTLTVKDSSGNTVWSGSGTGTSGTNSFTWDGTTTAGAQLSDGGQYTLNVSATDSTGQSVYGYTTVTGKVTSIDNSSGTPMLNIGSTAISTNNVIGVSA